MTTVEWWLMAQLVASVWMAALIWVVQLLVYPAFGNVPVDAWSAHHAHHSRRITFLVLPPMLVQLIAPVALLLEEPQHVSRGLVVAMLALGATTWLLTALISAPSHGRLGGGFTTAEHRRLVATNWPRTITWSAIAALSLVAWVLEQR